MLDDKASEEGPALFDNAGLSIFPDETGLDKQADQYKEILLDALPSEDKGSMLFVERIYEVYRVYIGLQAKVKNQYTEEDRFGTQKPHHLLSELRAQGVILDRLYDKAGFSPEARAKMGAPVKVAHGNAHSSNTLDIINGD